MGTRKNILSNVLLSSSAVVFPLITFPYVTRTLSTSSLGNYFFFDALTQYLIIFSAVGIPFYGIREVAKLKNNAASLSKLVMELLSVQVGLALLLTFVFAAAFILLPDLGGDLIMVKICCLNVISTSFLMEWFYQGIGKFTYITVRSIFIRSLSVIAILILVKHPDDQHLYYLILTGIVLVNSLLNLFFYFKDYHKPFPGKPEIFKHIKPLVVLFSINVSVSIYAVIDTLILKLLTTNMEVSYYNVPFKLVKIYWTLISAVGLVLIPRITEYFASNDKAAIRSAMEKSLNVVFLLGIPFCFFCLLFAGELINLISGPSYLPAVPALRMLSVVPLVIAVCNVFGTQFLMPIGKEKKILQGTLIGLVISLILNFLLTPHFRFIGTTIACVSAEIAVCCYIVFAAVREIKISLDQRLLSQIATSLVAVAIGRYFAVPYIQGTPLLVVAFSVYCLIFIVSQLFYFKNPFINALINFKNRAQ